MMVLLSLTRVPMVAPAFPLSASACNYTTSYQTKYVSLNSTYGRLEFAKVTMYKHFYFSTLTKQCYEQYHYMAATTTAPANWTVFASNASRTVVNVTVQLVSWSTFQAVGSWSLVSGCTNTTATLVQGGVGSTLASWSAAESCTAPRSAVLSDTGIQIYTWPSSRYGQSYPVAFTLRDLSPSGSTRTLTLNMTA